MKLVCWKIGMVVELLKGRDEVIRSVVVDYVTNEKHNQIKRSINMLYPVETYRLTTYLIAFKEKR